MYFPIIERSDQDQSAYIDFDEDGFVLEPGVWTRELAQSLADEYQLGELGSAHWEILDFLRDRYLRLGALPPMRRVCREFGHNRGAVKTMFGSCRGLWRIAGLPNPGEEAKAYMD